MLSKGLLSSAILFAVLLAPPGALARQSNPTAAAGARTPAELAPVDHPDVVTRHTGVFNGQALAYTATVGGAQVETRAGKVRLVSFAYTRDGADPHLRPVIFLFNGGPIVASMYIHIGGLGPKRIAFPDDVKAPPSSFKLVDNPFSPLDAADLVFVDPASTGYSRVLPGVDPKAFASVKADAAQIAGFIRQWVKDHGRSGAPIYVMGESYGTNRAAEIAGQLAEDPDPFPLAGVILYGQAVNIMEYAQRAANNDSYVASLPTLAAIAWYHGKVDRRGLTVEQFMAKASAYAKTTYLTALFRGNELPADERQAVADQLSAYTGLPAAWYLQNNLKITKERYRLELLKDQGLLLGRNDARYIAPVTDKGGAPDPSDVLSDSIERFFDDYRKTELKIDWAEPYLTAAPLGEDGLGAWGWGASAGPFGDYPYYLGVTKMMKLNPSFHLLVGNGYYDTQTTMGAAEMLATQVGWDRARVTLEYYDGGHMGYSVAATAKRLGDDLRALVNRSRGARP